MLGNVWAELLKSEISLICSNSLSNRALFRSQIWSHFLLQTNCRLKIRIVVSNRLRELSWPFVENSLPSRIQYFFGEKPRKVANFDEMRLHYFCPILYIIYNTITCTATTTRNTCLIFASLSNQSLIVKRCGCSSVGDVCQRSFFVTAC